MRQTAMQVQVTVNLANEVDLLSGISPRKSAMK
jgi:hypothetical protein